MPVWNNAQRRKPLFQCLINRHNLSNTNFDAPPRLLAINFQWISARFFFVISKKNQYLLCKPRHRLTRVVATISYIRAILIDRLCMCSGPDSIIKIDIWRSRLLGDSVFFFSQCLWAKMVYWFLMCKTCFEAVPFESNNPFGILTQALWNSKFELHGKK